MKKLIRGVIYDNPNVLEEREFATVMTLSDITDSASERYDEELSDFDLPSKEEFMVSSAISAICKPFEGENLIIPSNMIDNKLYKNLKKIDIGEELLESYIAIRGEKYLEEHDDREVIYPEDKEMVSSNTPIIHMKFNSRDELLDGISDLHNAGILSSETCIDIINRLNQIA